ncbi:helix-turn-helix domain-containing protein [Streptomyces sp. NPDC059853]|uniref:helix-turn-helix domain-containing protein n=1 Tax=Streptomyces TaxID=1883 RepID=UPI0034DF059B
MAVVASGSPLTARRKLGGELRRLRDRFGLTTEDVAAHLKCHATKVSRFELGKRSVTRRDFEALMELYDVGDEQRAELTEHMIRGKQRVPPWWDAYSDVLTVNYSEYIAYEAEAVRGGEYQSLLIPGLLQTRDYAHAVTEGGYASLGPDQVDSLVDVRMRRQQRLTEEEPLLFEGVMTEAALRLQIGGPEVMREQLRTLARTAELPNVSVRIIPFTAGAKAAVTGGFSLFGTDADADADVAFTESAESATTLKDSPIVLRLLNRQFRNLSAAALSQEDSHDMVRRIEKELD